MSRKHLSTTLEINTPEPLYKQVETQILQCLADGEWKPGDKLPTEAGLARRFGVAVFTIRSGLSDLVAANILVRKQGKGTFVTRHDSQRQYHFANVFHNDGIKLFPEREFVSFRKIAATKAISRILKLRLDDHPTVFHIAGLMRVDGKPAGTTDIVIPTKIFSGLTARAIRESTKTLFSVYQDVCGVNVLRVEERVYARCADTAIARALKIATGNPVLRVERIAYTFNDIPVEFRVREFDATKYHYRHPVEHG